MEKVDNYTAFAVIPDEGGKVLHYGTFYGACLSYSKGTWNWVKIQKNIVSKGSKCDHGGSDRYLRYNCTWSPFHNRLWHSMMAMLFQKVDLTGKQVHHLNNDGLCCRADNLVVVTPKEHAQYHKDMRSGKIIITNLQKSKFYVTH